MTKDEIDKILEFCMKDKEVRSKYSFIHQNEEFESVMKFVEHLFLYGVSLEEVKELIQTHQNILRKEKLEKINKISKNENDGNT